MGHRKALRELLPMLRDWQAAHHYPFDLSTQITINLADDAALMQMMRDANFSGVFIGIESTDEETLIASRKKQNAYRELIECIGRIRQAGMFVQTGLIVGFDTEQGSVASATADFVDKAAITWAAVSLMHALPHTQLTRRLEREGRLYSGTDIQPTFSESTPFGVGLGLNFKTKRPRRDIICDYVAILETLYAPEAYFSRLRREGRAVRRPNFRQRSTPKMRYRELRAFRKIRVADDRHTSGAATALLGHDLRLYAQQSVGAQAGHRFCKHLSGHRTIQPSRHKRDEAPGGSDRSKRADALFEADTCMLIARTALRRRQRRAVR